MFIDEEVYLEHYGKAGMRWGVRKNKIYPGYEISRKESDKEKKAIQKSNSRKEKLASKNPTFKREVKATMKGRGIDGVMRPEVTKKGEVFTGRLLGTFTNSKNEKVSTDFANAVLHKVGKKRDVRNKIKLGALLTTAIVAPKIAQRAR